MSFYDEIKHIQEGVGVPLELQGCISRILEDLLEDSDGDTIENVSNDIIDFDLFCDTVESWRLSKNKLGKYFKVNSNYEVTLTKITKSILRDVIISTGYSRFYC